MARKRRKKKTTAAPPLPSPRAGEQLWLLELPWGMRDSRLSYRKDIKASLYVGEKVPDDLEPYAAKPYSYLAWVQDQINRRSTPTMRASAAPKSPRAEQIEDARAIVTAAAAGWRGILVANATGTGKTLACIIAAKAICSLRGGNTVVVTVDRPARMSIPMWRSAIASVGDGGLRWIIVSSDGGLKILLHPNGQPRLNPCVVINDEAHVFRRDSQRTARMRRINRLDVTPAKDVPFCISVTATPVHSPTEYRYLASLFAQIHGEPVAAWKDLDAALKRKGIDADKHDSVEVAMKVRDWLLRSDPPLMLNRPAPWGAAEMEALPVTLSPDQMRQYLLEWGDFQREMHLARRGADVAKGLAALTRFRQKAAYLRVEETVEKVLADIEDGYQVLVAVEHVTTAADPIAQLLEDRGEPVARIYGGRDTLEQERIKFQRGRCKVAVINTVSSISLHANEQLADGTVATTAPRRGYFHQPRYSAIAAQQMMGRAHRDGQHCPWFLLYGENTIEEKAAQRMTERLIVNATSVDADTSFLASLASLFGADWLPMQSAFDE